MALSSYCSLLAVVEIERGVLLDMIIGCSLAGKDKVREGRIRI